MKGGLPQISGRECRFVLADGRDSGRVEIFDRAENVINVPIADLVRAVGWWNRIVVSRIDKMSRRKHETA